ncbi:MAG: hypothetical protein ACLP7Q_23650, partial [Isosphaeraceae bacterium]
VAAVLAHEHREPSSRTCLTSRRRRAIRLWNPPQSRVLSRTLCQLRNSRFDSDSNRDIHRVSLMDRGRQFVIRSLRKSLWRAL